MRSATGSRMLKTVMTSGILRKGMEEVQKEVTTFSYRTEEDRRSLTMPTIVDTTLK